MPSYAVRMYQHLLSGGRLWNWKQNERWHRTRMRENGSSLILTSSRYQVPWYLRTGFANISSTAQFIFGKMIPCRMFLFIQTFCEQQIYWKFPLCCAWLDLFLIFIWSLLACEYSYNPVTPSFWLCLCADSRLCCTHFSYHWCKVCNISCQLSQKSLKQHYPWNTIVIFLHTKKQEC